LALVHHLAFHPPLDLVEQYRLQMICYGSAHWQTMAMTLLLTARLPTKVYP
jgi:hypothetical protein